MSLTSADHELFYEWSHTQQQTRKNSNRSLLFMLGGLRAEENSATSKVSPQVNP